jgi:purine nucleoside phosphorylase
VALGIITGSGTYAMPGFDASGAEWVTTEWGSALVTRGSLGGVEALHVSRHLEGHERLSNHVEHRANIAALDAAGAAGVLAVTVCGAVDPQVELGSLICFDDLHFLANRLPAGGLCTFFDRPGDERRGHWIYGDPFAGELRRAFLAGGKSAGLVVRDGGCYGHVDGPRFNTRAEIRSLALAGVTAVSQTGGPEAVLAGELELPYALVGFATDYANGVREAPTPVDELLGLIERSWETVPRLLAAAAAAVDPAAPVAPGTVYRFHAPG